MSIRIVDAETVRSWARKRGMTVANRGRLSPAVVDAFNTAHKAQVYVVQPRPAVTVVKLAGRKADKAGRNRKVTVTATIPAVRTWASAAGFEVGRRGRISQPVLHAYSIREANLG